LLAQARRLDSIADIAAAKAAYLEILRQDPTHFRALNELGSLALETGHRSAARTAYEQAVRYHPQNPVARVNLGNVLYEACDYPAARVHYEAALLSSPGMSQAHQGLGGVFAALGDEVLAEEHWRQGFTDHAVLSRRYRGNAPPIPLLLLVSAKGGNIPTRQIIDERAFEVTVLYPEYFEPARALPAHAVVFNAIGDADLCTTALSRAESLLHGTAANVINPPTAVRRTGRVTNAERLAHLAGVIVPKVRSLDRSMLLAGEGLSYPLLLRSPGFHTGRHFARVERHAELAALIGPLPGKELLAIDYLDARGRDGMARKYRVMFIDHALYPLHLAVSNDWKVHYFSSEMRSSAVFRDEEQRFLEDMPAVLGTRAVAALQEIERTLGLDFAGIDFAIDRDGLVLIFEANATMVINPPDADPMWDYRRAPIARAHDAARELLRARAHGAREHA
jgi:glutathione synthase/RimK-type ligase-like ATP-grasp enzyme